MDTDSEPVHLKLFGNSGEACAEEDYFESFFNLELGSGWVAWNEKDEDYREPLLRALSR